VTKKPKCKICPGSHWSYEGHDLSESPKVPGYIKEMVQFRVGPQPEGVTTVTEAETVTYVEPVPTPPEVVPTNVPTECIVPTCSRRREGRYKLCAGHRKARQREG
jgi:hypothetical protein